MRTAMSGHHIGRGATSSGLGQPTSMTSPRHRTRRDLKRFVRDHLFDFGFPSDQH
jgi:hypothetical protein